MTECFTEFMVGTNNLLPNGPFLSSVHNLVTNTIRYFCKQIIIRYYAYMVLVF